MSDGLLLFLRSARGLISFRIHTAAPGPLNLTSVTEGGGQLQGYWLDRPDGYQVEISLPLSSELVDLSLGAVDVVQGVNGRQIASSAGTLDNSLPSGWLHLEPKDSGLSDWLAEVIPQGSRAWVLDTGAWVMADSGPTQPTEGRELSFVERLIYRAVAGSRTELLGTRPDQLVRLDEALVSTALSGSTAQHWGQDPESAQVRNSVAVPIQKQGRVRGAVVVEADSDGVLLVTNRALGRLLLSTLLLTFGLALGLWFFATRLSRRVQKLSSAVSQAMDDSGKPGVLPLTQDKDELGELARNNARLLKAISNYTGYLQKLAGRLSHELKTPLAITRSSLDNLVSQDLDEEASRYVQRAREGLDRQAAIVRSMSEASRLEAAVEVADWESVDLVTVLGHCVDAYRSVYPGREISFEYSESPCNWHCAPDMIAQALDKLVENAMSFTGPNDEIHVGIDYSPHECRISVRNTGSCLPDMLPEQLFDSLVSMRDKGGGRHLGLGLHIVRLVAEAHGGTASARNLDSNEGVVFTIHLVSD
jgi:signal transduction histidine kinase